MECRSERKTQEHRLGNECGDVIRNRLYSSVPEESDAGGKGTLKEYSLYCLELTAE